MHCRCLVFIPFKYDYVTSTNGQDAVPHGDSKRKVPIFQGNFSSSGGIHY